MKESFIVTPRVIAHLGEDLIKNSSIALLELVKNAYDAGATECCVDFHVNNGSLSKITITDNGQGMDLYTIKNVYLVIGTNHKQNELNNKVNNNEYSGRYPLGEKGIGRLGAHKLGHKVYIFSKTKKEPEIELFIDWQKLKSSETIDDFKIDINENNLPKHFKKDSTGTIIIIEELRGDWDRRQIREIHRNLMSLHSPFSKSDDEFDVKITSNDDLFGGLPDFDDIINAGLYSCHCKMCDKEITEFSYRFKPWKSLTKIDKGRIVSLENLQEIDKSLKGIRDSELSRSRVKDLYVIDLTAAKIGEIEFDLVIFEKDAQIFSYVNTEKSSINKYLNENGGIRVYRDNVRIYDYGERDNDWLGIDLKRVHHVGGNVSNNIILGSVRIKRTESSGLREKTNREGFIENKSYQVFVDAVNSALSLFVRFRNQDKAILTSLYKKTKVTEPVISDLEEVIDIVGEHIQDSEIKTDVLKHLYRIDEQYKTVKETLIKSANAGLNLSVVIHEIEKQVAALIGFAERKEADKVIAIAKRLEKIVRGYSSMIRKSSISNLSLNKLAKTSVDNYFFRFSDHNIKVTINSDRADIFAICSEAETVSVITNILDNSIFWLTYARKEDREISIYITTKLKEYYSIIISDNGPGFNIPFEIATQPFISGKPNNMGMGLGLHISTEMMHAMKGKLLFLDENEIVLPEHSQKNGIVRAIVALCFPKGDVK
jgi:signal transduction histidine kinase